MLLDSDWFWFTLIDFGLLWLILIGSDWCRLKLIDADHADADHADVNADADDTDDADAAADQGWTGQPIFLRDREFHQEYWR